MLNLVLRDDLNYLIHIGGFFFINNEMVGNGIYHCIGGTKFTGLL